MFIAGTGRSGTTILSNILGQVPGCFAGGEIRYAWQRGVVEDHRCGCGLPFSACPVWTAVMRDVSKDNTDLDPAAVAHRIDGRLRVRSVPRMALRMLRRQPIVKPHGDDADILGVYRALSRRPGVEVIVDSSTLPLYGMMLAALPGVEMSVIHVVRDPRATAFSWRRQKLTGDTDDEATMPQLEIWRSAVLWLVWNLLTDVWLARSTLAHMLVRYEELVAEPRATLDRVVSMVDRQMPEDVIREHTVTLVPTHSVAGNPARHSTGEIELYADTEWRTAMPVSQRLLVALLTLPALRRFGYPLGAGGR